MQPICDKNGTGHCRKTSLPLETILGNLKAQGQMVECSKDAGKYICNYTYYKNLMLQEQAVCEGVECDALFVHVPNFSKVSKIEQ
jgi:pyrrolidone-carboxylate peptidase